jgi:hypothetical protein
MMFFNSWIVGAIFIFFNISFYPFVSHIDGYISDDIGRVIDYRDNVILDYGFVYQQDRFFFYIPLRAHGECNYAKGEGIPINPQRVFGMLNIYEYLPFNGLISIDYKQVPRSYRKEFVQHINRNRVYIDLCGG